LTLKIDSDGKILIAAVLENLFGIVVGGHYLTIFWSTTLGIQCKI
jgi:hypothetical protein